MRTPVQPTDTVPSGGGGVMEKKRERAHEIAEEGLDTIIEGDMKKGRNLFDPFIPFDIAPEERNAAASGC